MISRGAWMAAFGTAAVLHAGIGWQFYRHEPEPSISVPLSIVEASLITAPDAPVRMVPSAHAKPMQSAKETPPVHPVESFHEPLLAREPDESVASPLPIATTTASSSAPVESEPSVEAPRFDAAYLDNPPPAYPLSARRRGIEGRVWVRAQVRDDGHCDQIVLRQSSGVESLDQAALAAVKSWRFVPARQGARTVIAWVDVPIVFKLKE